MTENIDEKLTNTTNSVYLNPVFDDNDEAKINTPLLNNSTNDEQSPYEEVAANVSNKDDPTMLCLTFRSVLVGILLTCLTAFTTQFFAYRTSPLPINAGIIILLSYIIGKFLSKILPEKILNITLNPGPFTVKEHALITIMATSSAGTVYVIEALTVQRLYYDFYLNHLNSILFIIITHLVAFSIAGLLKRYLIWPSAMIWPETLLTCGLIRTLDTEDEMDKTKSRWTMKRSTFFWLIVLFQFIYYWLPGYIFPLLSFFSIVCMIAPYNVIFSQITGANGLGLGAIELDWNAWVAYLNAPILVPFWAHVNIFIGFVISIWIATPIFYYTNIWNLQKMPIISNRVFDINGNFYNISEVLDSNLHLNESAYKIYGEMRMTAAYALSYSFIFACMSALIVHTALYHGKSIVEQFRSSLSDKRNDIHAKLITHYPAISEGWYYLILVIACFLGLAHSYSNKLISGYIILFSIILNFIFALPLAIITALTSLYFLTSVPNDILSDFITPGNPISYLVFRTYTYTCQFQVLIFLTQWKIAHYMKIPPRLIFCILIICSIIASIIHYLTALYLLNNVPDICTSKSLSWKCLNVESTYTVSIIWGLVGTAKLFGPNSQYFPLLLGFVFGLIFPVISWLLWKKYPNKKWLGFIHFPIIFVTTTYIPPAPAAEFPSWFLVGFIFNFIIYRYAHEWWEKYAYIFSAGMSCGVAICGFVIFFTLQNNNIYFPKWWGTGGLIGDGCPLATANISGVIPIDREL